MRKGPEQSYIGKFDRAQTKVTGQGQAAEDIVLMFFKKTFPGMEIRRATEREDSGAAGQGIGGKMIDAVLYENTGKEVKPALALQITTNTDPWAIRKKLDEMKTFPFVRLEEMNHQDAPIPKALVYLEPPAVKAFMDNPDFSRHPQVAKQILDGVSKSLKYDLSKATNPKEQQHIQRILQLVEEQMRNIA